MIKREFSPILVLSLALALSACNSTDSSLGVDTTGNNAAPTPTVAAPAIAGQSQVYFAPIVGAPVANVTALSRRLSAAATANNISLQPTATPTINHEIRGYFSALSDAGSTTVIHVWDVFSPDGQRVHRIQGQEQIAGQAADPWSIVPAATMEAIADTVLSQYAQWRSTS
ncbi:MAG: hypothetical protein U5K75_00940 [Ahrensia sp.]|nr:hypothetical protein [Ahrensia sp.]